MDDIQLILKITSDLDFTLPLHTTPDGNTIKRTIDTIRATLALRGGDRKTFLVGTSVSQMVVSSACAQLRQYSAQIAGQISNLTIQPHEQNEAIYYYIKNNKHHLCLMCNTQCDNIRQHVEKCQNKLNNVLQQNGCGPCANGDRTKCSHLHLFDNNHITVCFMGLNNKTLDVQNLMDIRHYDLTGVIWLPASILAFEDTIKNTTKYVGALNYYFYNHTVIDFCNASPILVQAVTEVKLNPAKSKEVKLSCAKCSNMAFQEYPFHYSYMFLIFPESITFYDGNCGHQCLKITSKLNEEFFPLHELINKKLAGNTTKTDCFYKTVFHKDRKDDYDEDKRHIRFNSYYGRQVNQVAVVQSAEQQQRAVDMADDLLTMCDLGDAASIDELFNSLINDIPELISSEEKSHIVSDFPNDIQTTYGSESIYQKTLLVSRVPLLPGNDGVNSKSKSAEQKEKKCLSQIGNEKENQVQSNKTKAKKNAKKAAACLPNNKSTKKSEQLFKTLETEQYIQYTHPEEKPMETNAYNFIHSPIIAARLPNISTGIRDKSNGLLTPRINFQPTTELIDCLEVTKHSNYMQHFKNYVTKLHDQLYTEAEIISFFIFQNYSAFFKEITPDIDQFKNINALVHEIQVF